MAVVCPLLRGSSPTRGVAPKQHRGLGRAFSPAFRAGSLYPLARGCRRIWRGEVWKYGFGAALTCFVTPRARARGFPQLSVPARCGSTGSGRLGGAGCWPHDGELAGGAVADFVVVLSASRRGPRRSQLRGQLRHAPIATNGWGAPACFLSGISGWFSLRSEERRVGKEC